MVVDIQKVLIFTRRRLLLSLISEGGTELAISSNNSQKPWLSMDPKKAILNPILTNCSRKGQNLQIQGTGHGDFVHKGWKLVGCI